MAAALSANAGTTYMPVEMAMFTNEIRTAIGTNGTTAVGTRFRNQRALTHYATACSMTTPGSENSNKEIVPVKETRQEANEQVRTPQRDN
jgi:hypothetical protein